MRGKERSDDIKEKAIAMLLSGSSLSEVSKKLKLPKSTVADWKNKNHETNDEIGRLRTQKKLEFAEKAAEIIKDGLNVLSTSIKAAINDPENNKINPRDMAVIIGTLYDKRALAQGDSTANSEIKIKLGKELDDLAD